ncbi:spore coat protein H [Entomortierella parvispora]|uniref:Spore coat protein H n=1 Tax=Entomortierella parvispora TaxID=205924 RepID=A0A9P3H9B2_9FUNG|nr:spore coat protein H [Entomortierella parvispora]
MLWHYFPGILAIASIALADVTFNVVGFPDSEGEKFGVMIDNKITELSSSAATFPLWSGKVAGTSSSAYQYVQLSASGAVLKKEPFVRSLKHQKGGKTLNEFFAREVLVTSLPKIPQIYPNVEPRASKAFDDRQIGTIHLKANPAEFSDMLKHPQALDWPPVKASFRFINSDTVYSSDAVTVKVSGHGSRSYQKLSLRVKFDGAKPGGKNTFFDRPIIKLRSETADPTLIREKLYFDALNSVGSPTAEGSYVRVYVNNKPYGFFLMVEDIDAPFLRSTMQRGSHTKAVGSLYKMGSHVTGKEATLQYEGPSTSNYDPGVYENKILGANSAAEPMAQLIQFFKDLQEFDPSKPGAIRFWKARFDLDNFLRYMAMEYLGGNWDAYWWKGNNYFMYYNPVRSIWQFIPTDFDSTFNDGSRPDVVTDYKHFAASRLKRPGKDHPLITKLILKNKDINALFEEILSSIVKGVFKPEVLNPRIDAYVSMIRDEVKWDLSISRTSNQGKRGFTLEDFNNGIKQSVQTINYGIKPWIESRASSFPKQISKK